MIRIPKTLTMPTIPRIYECDPNKNIGCTKEGCFVRGGPCHRTSIAIFQREMQTSECMQNLEIAVIRAMPIVARESSLSDAERLYEAFLSVKKEYERNEDDLK